MQQVDYYNARLTAPNQELDRLVRQTPPGMMFWAGTCADPTATCSGCKHYGGNAFTVRNDAGNAVTSRKQRKPPKECCALYKQHTGRRGKPFDPKTPACKYYEAK